MAGRCIRAGHLHAFCETLEGLTSALCSYRKAKEEGWRARSAFKLLQIDDAFNIFEGNPAAAAADDGCKGCSSQLPMAHDMQHLPGPLCLIERNVAQQSPHVHAEL